MSKIKTVILLFILMSMTRMLTAQQDHIFSQYMFDQVVFNPACAGSTDKINTSLLYRQQWANRMSTPTSLFFSVSTPFNQRRNGIGMQVYNTTNAFLRYSEVNISYSYRIIFANGLLSMGINGGIVQLNSGINDGVAKDLEDPLLEKLDNINAIKPDLGTGLYYQNKNFYVGVSLSHLIPMVIKAGESDFPARKLHIYGHTGYKIKLSDRVQYIVSGLIKHVPGYVPQLDITNHLMVNNQFWGGVSYRSYHAVALQAGVRLDRIVTRLRQDMRVGYSADLNFNFPGTSHEIMLIINWEIHRSPEQIKRQKVQLSPFFL